MKRLKSIGILIRNLTDSQATGFCFGLCLARYLHAYRNRNHAQVTTFSDRCRRRAGLCRWLGFLSISDIFIKASRIASTRVNLPTTNARSLCAERTRSLSLSQKNEFSAMRSWQRRSGAWNSNAALRSLSRLRVKVEWFSLRPLLLSPTLTSRLTTLSVRRRSLLSV